MGVSNIRTRPWAGEHRKGETIVMDPGPLFGLVERQRREADRNRKQQQEGEHAPRTQPERSRAEQPDQDKSPQDE